jgi:hypothetical protein
VPLIHSFYEFAILLSSLEIEHGVQGFVYGTNLSSKAVASIPHKPNRPYILQK